MTTQGTVIRAGTQIEIRHGMTGEMILRRTTERDYEREPLELAMLLLVLEKWHAPPQCGIIEWKMPHEERNWHGRLLLRSLRSLERKLGSGKRKCAICTMPCREARVGRTTAWNCERCHPRRVCAHCRVYLDENAGAEELVCYKCISPKELDSLTQWQKTRYNLVYGSDATANRKEGQSL